jgi:hypothetical protein
MNERIDAAAAQVRIRDLDGHELPLSATWAERPAVLVFVRHFG